MKRALCVNSMEDIGALIRGEAETIDSCLVTRDICEDPNNKFLQIIPYVVFFTPRHAEGKLLFAHYKRAAKGTEERLQSKSSIGFGGPLRFSPARAVPEWRAACGVA
jgi:predicted NUDIX family phosphoesterase